MIGNKSEKFYSLYESERKKIEKKLQSSLKNRKPESLYKPALYIIEGQGKRLRPLLVLFSAKAAGGNYSMAYNAAVAVELLHNFTLVHDDIMDNADKRRGRLTLHKMYDDNTAILAGDGLLAVAYEILLKDCKENAASIVASFTKGLIEVCEGQSLDKDFEIRKEVSIEEYLEMIGKKTAAMAQMCCSIGALAGGGSKNEIKALESFGRNIGIAFQILDDLLDIIGDEEKTGKFTGGDLMEGKKTFLFLKALEKSKGESRKALLKVVKNKGVKKDEIEQYKKLYEELGVLEDSKKEIKKYTDKALKGLKALKRDEDKELFAWLAHSLINRNR